MTFTSDYVEASDYDSIIKEHEHAGETSDTGGNEEMGAGQAKGSGLRVASEKAIADIAQRQDERFGTWLNRYRGLGERQAVRKVSERLMTETHNKGYFCTTTKTSKYVAQYWCLH